MKEKIVDLMREKYGISQKVNAKKLNINSKDNLFSAYRKLALYLYANHDLTTEEEIEIVKERITEASISVEPDKCDEELHRVDSSELSTTMQDFIANHCKKLKNSNSDGWKDHVYMFKNNASERSFVVLSPDGLFKNSVLFGTYSRKDYFTDVQETLLFVNLPLSYGYQKIQKDFYQTYEDKEMTKFKNTDLVSDIFRQNFTKSKFAQYYPILSNVQERVKYARKVLASDCTIVRECDYDSDNSLAKLPENSYVFQNENGRYVPSKADDTYFYNIKLLVEVTIQSDPGRCFMSYRQLARSVENDFAIRYLNNYLQRTQNILLQYDHDLEMQSTLNHARFFEEKKNISHQTQRTMTIFENMLVDKFSHVEIDNDVQLEKLNHVKDELREITNLLPISTEGERAILRFRKLRNHHALGIFTPVNNTIAIDFRSDEDGKIEKGIGKENVGLQSLIHEYGHYLDYNTVCDSTMLSLSTEFSNILFAVQSDLAAHSKELSSHGERLSYLTTPSEIFARSFEIYVYQHGLDSTFTKDPEQLSEETENLKYKYFSHNVRLLINVYFDNEFPALRKNIHNYLDQQKPVTTVAKVCDVSTSYQVQSDSNLLNNSYNHVKQLSLF